MQKIENQARALSIAGLDGSEQLFLHKQKVSVGDKGNMEGIAAKEYFQFLHPGLNRRTDDPFNSALNYGYAIVRAAIAKELVATGFIPAFGIHHKSQLNAFNLADDMIEPYRPIVDIVALSIVESSLRLSPAQRRELRKVLYAHVEISGRKTSVLGAIKMQADSLRKAIENKDPSQLLLPIVQSISYVDPVRE